MVARLTTKQLAQTLSAIDETGSMAQAAKTLGYSYDSIRYHIRTVNKQIGSPALSTKTHRGSNVTEAGRWYIKTHLKGGDALS